MPLMVRSTHVGVDGGVEVGVTVGLGVPKAGAVDVGGGVEGVGVFDGPEPQPGTIDTKARASTNAEPGGIRCGPRPHRR